jgi:hypothetical protein
MEVFELILGIDRNRPAEPDGNGRKPEDRSFGAVAQLVER